MVWRCARLFPSTPCCKCVLSSDGAANYYESLVLPQQGGGLNILHNLKLYFNEGRAFEFYEAVEQVKARYDETRGRGGRAPEEALRESDPTFHSYKRGDTLSHSMQLCTRRQIGTPLLHRLEAVRPLLHRKRDKDHTWDPMQGSSRLPPVRGRPRQRKMPV